MRDNRSLEQKIKTVVRESSEKRNSEIRMKMSNVGRPTDGPSKLAKQGEIQRKIIDEDSVASVSTKDTPKEQPESGKKKKDAGNEKDLMEPGTIKGGKTEVDLEPSTDDRDDDGKKISDKMKKATKEANAKAGVKEETMNITKNFGLPADLIKTVEEALKGGQKKIDKNHNGKIDGQDFKILRGEKVKKEEVENIEERNTENKAKKDAAAMSVGSKNRDEHHNAKRGMRTDVADKIRGREVMQGKPRVRNEEVEQIYEEEGYHIKDYDKKTAKQHMKPEWHSAIKKAGYKTPYKSQTHYGIYANHKSKPHLEYGIHPHTGAHTVHVGGKKYHSPHEFLKDHGHHETNEEVEQIDELDRGGMLQRYADKTRKQIEGGEKPTDYRAAGRLMAGKKRWGGTGGIPAAKVPAVTREETDPGFSAKELARIEEIHNNLDEVVTARKLTAADKAARAKWLEGHKAKVASLKPHTVKADPKSFKARNTEPGNYEKEPSQMHKTGLLNVLTKQDTKVSK